jgi:hypothetical protein
MKALAAFLVIRARFEPKAERFRLRAESGRSEPRFLTIRVALCGPFARNAQSVHEGRFQPLRPSPKSERIVNWRVVKLCQQQTR